MSRRGHRRRHERDDNSIPNTHIPVLHRATVNNSRLLGDVSDRRHYHPDDLFRPLYSVRTYQRDIVDVNVNRKPVKSWKAPTQFGFRVPHKVDVCVKRKERREVLFAKRKTGKGSRTPKRRNYNSDVRC